MKIQLLLAFSLLTININFAQKTYYPLVDTNKTWHVLEAGFGGNTYTITYTCEGDTIINNENYKNVFFTYEEFPVNWIHCGFIREDENHKVYYSEYQPNNPAYFEPRLLYDFDAEINDTLTITSFPYHFPTEIEIVITGIDSVLAGGAFRKRTWFDCESYDYNYWIEGIGSNNGLKEPGFYCTVVCPTVDLLCVKENGVIIYHNDYYESCYIVGVVENIENSIHYQIYPNPAKEYIIVSPVLNPDINNKLFLYSPSGKIIGKYKLNRFGPTHIEFPHLTNGLYFYRIENEGIEIQSGKVVVL